MTNEKKKLDGIIQAIKEFDAPNDSAQELINWIESTCPWFSIEGGDEE